MEAECADPNIAARIVAILLAVGAALATPLALFMAMMSVMAFDAPGSENNNLLWALVFGIWATPLVLVAVVVLAIIAAVRARWKMLLWSLAPVGALLVYLTVTFTLLDQMCGGQTRC